MEHNTSLITNTFLTLGLALIFGEEELAKGMTK